VKPLAHTASAPPAAIPADVITDLRKVEARLSEELASREPRLGCIAEHLVGAGGKRVRPLVVLLIYHATATDLRRRADVIDAAVALELIHSATLLHDDIIDGCETRRGRPSALATFGTAETLVAGDFLFSRAFALCARFEAEVIRWAANACIALTEGEIMQGRFRHNPAVTYDDYLEIIRRKTASLFAAGARTAAHLGNAPAAIAEAMARCGEEVGLAFQMSDDLLDVNGRPDTTGKPRGVDLRDGNPSLPVVLALPDHPEIARLFAEPHLDAAGIARALSLIQASGVVSRIERLADERVDRAIAEIRGLEPSSARAALEALAVGLTERRA
jgi:geranylgeranyl pyrophosphate synthase